MNLTVSNNHLKNLISKLLTKLLCKKLKFPIDISIDELNIETPDDKIQIHLDARGEMKSEDLIKIFKTNGIL
jgi:hypothetical protein